MVCEPYVVTFLKWVPSKVCGVIVGASNSMANFHNLDQIENCLILLAIACNTNLHFKHQVQVEVQIL